MGSQKRVGRRTVALARAICCAGILSACATGTNNGDVSDSGIVDSGTTIDAAIPLDAGQVDSGQGEVDASIADAGNPDAAIADAGLPDGPSCVVASLELLSNGNFDMGAGTWIEDSEGGYPIVANDSTVTGLTADTPSFVAWIGGYSSIIGTVTDTLLQDVLVPADATPIAFSGKFRIATEETSSIAYDELKLQILNSATNVVLEELVVWSNDDNNTNWEIFSGNSTGNYAGQTIRIRFIATMDSSLNTSFFIDTWSATTTSCQ